MRINAAELLKSDRLDVIVKIKYIENREKNYHLKYILDLYKEHIDVFSDGTFTEPDTPEKNNILKYMSAFDKVIDSVKEKGIDETISTIPVDSSYTLTNGAHRTAAAFYFNKSVPITITDIQAPVFDVELMKKRHMKEEFIDYIVNEYVKLKQDGIYIAIMWPRGNWKSQKDAVLEKFTKFGKIIYSKDIKLNYNGIRNLAIQAYYRHEFAGSYKNHFKGIDANVYFDKKQTTMIVYEADNLEKVLEAKKGIRDILSVGNSSIHITDTHREAVELANMLLNANTIDFINSAQPDKCIGANRNIQMFIQRVEENGLDIDDFAVDASTVLALYGLRKSNDLDYLSLSEEAYKVNNEVIDNHDNHMSYYGGLTKADLIYDPSSYFRYMNVKFIIPQYVRQWKKNRNEKKDRSDVALLEQVIQKKKLNYKTVLLRTQLAAYHVKRALCHRIKLLCKKVIPKKLYNYLKTQYHKLKADT